MSICHLSHSLLKRQKKTTCSSLFFPEVRVIVHENPYLTGKIMGVLSFFSFNHYRRPAMCPKCPRAIADLLTHGSVGKMTDVLFAKKARSWRKKWSQSIPNLSQNDQLSTTFNNQNDPNCHDAAELRMVSNVKPLCFCWDPRADDQNQQKNTMGFFSQ